MSPSPIAARGFTIIELMVVVAIAAILGTLGTSGFSSLIKSQRAKNASFEFYSSLLLARSEAIKRGGNVTLSAAGGSWGAGWSIVAADGEVIKNQSALNGIVITPSVTNLIYSRSGRTTAVSFRVDTEATATANARCIKIELSGMPRSTPGACS